MVGCHKLAWGKAERFWRSCHRVLGALVLGPLLHRAGHLLGLYYFPHLPQHGHPGRAEIFLGKESGVKP